jgi:hypothetical protein
MRIEQMIAATGDAEKRIPTLSQRFDAFPADGRIDIGSVSAFGKSSLCQASGKAAAEGRRSRGHHGRSMRVSGHFRPSAC